MKQKKWTTVVLFTLGFLFIANMLHTFFMHQKQWEPIEISFLVEADFDTFIWTNLQPKFKDSAVQSTRVSIKKNIPKTYSFKIKEPNGINFLGLYWSRSDLGTFKISNAILKSNKKQWELEHISEVVSYSSNNISITSEDTVLRAISEEKGNGWLMLHTDILQEISKNKRFVPFGWVVNILLALVGLIIGVFYKKEWKNWVQFSGSTIEKTRRYVLAFWFFIFPFWLQISHTLLAISLALLIVEYLVKKERIPLATIKLFVPLFLLFIFIIAIDAFFHFEEIANDFGDYSYFLLVPFVFIGIEKEDLQKIITFFQIGIIGYLVLLIITAIERYFSLEITYSFLYFFFETVEQYWHTSYLASLIILPLLFHLLHKKITPLCILICILAFGLLYIIKARLPLLMGVILTIFIYLINVPKKIRNTTLIIFGATILGLFLFVSISDNYQKKLTNYLLVNETQKIDARPELWEVSIEIAKENPLKGIGRSNVRTELSKRVTTTSHIKNRGYNTHNQYLEFLLSYGALAPLILVLVFAVPIYKKYKTATMFVVYFSIAMLVESYFSRQSGIVIFSVFYAFFVLYDSKNK